MNDNECSFCGEPVASGNDVNSCAVHVEILTKVREYLLNPECEFCEKTGTLIDGVGICEDHLGTWEEFTNYPCDMKYEEPYDFSICEAHDTTFPIEGVCKFFREKVE